MKLYEVKLVLNESEGMKKKLKSEETLKDLLELMPKLKKHKLEGEIHSTIKKLRSGRKTKAYSLELTRKYNGEIISVKAPVPKLSDKLEIMRKLKADIRTEIKKRRAEALPVVEQYSFRYGLTVPRLAEVFLEKGSFYKVMLKKIRSDMVNNKSPKTLDRYVGIELEMAGKEDRNTVCDKIFNAGIGKCVTVKGDGSIGAGKAGLKDFEVAHEINILCRESELEEVVTKLCAVLNEQLHVKVDKTCGLHVHVDMRNREVATCFHNLVSCQQFLYAMLPAARRSSNYSYPVKGTQWRVLPERYHGINSQAYAKYKTLEMRMHCGTTQASKIINWTRMLIAIADAPKIAAAPTTVEAFKTSANLTEVVSEYVKSRVAKFAAQHKSTVPSHEQPGTMPNIEDIIGTVSDTEANEESEVA
jgi:Putative amidoligase enzyme